MKRSDIQEHTVIALRAADSAETVLAYFERRHPQDARPRRAIEAARAWARGELAMAEARVAAFAAYAAAYAAKAESAASDMDETGRHRRAKQLPARLSQAVRRQDQKLA